MRQDEKQWRGICLHRKQSKKWDVTPVLIPKEYKYIPQLEVIFAERGNSSSHMKQKDTLPADHPGRIQRTIAHVAPVVHHI